ncbi:hypothetical protein HY638_04880 [Candidatus Woesearchaeota archaeon]|nr:hypothetical protein [Candidatus Woesearchaeota archaeon]
MINEFHIYMKGGKVKSKTPDPEEAKALIEKSQKRVKYISKKGIDRDNASFILEDSYEAVWEASQSLMSVKGYKPYSHEATISFLKEFYPEIFG